MKEKIKLTQYSHGGGCGCKIAPDVLDKILKNNDNIFKHSSNILVGNDTKDDAAVYQMDKNTALISTLDFFTPIVDDPYIFGQIAATNSISDIYAMGGYPILALAILGFPVSKLPIDVAKKIILGAKKVCKDAGISLAGGHSIDSVEPIFGLSVNGKVDIKNLKKNNTAKEGDKIFITKPLGVGILASAQKVDILRDKDKNVAKKIMLTLNNIGFEIGKLKYVNAMTDVTGFGLLGHLIEVCEGSALSSELYFHNIVLPKCIDYYLDMECVPEGTMRNKASYGKKANNLTDKHITTLCDPQTSGGLLIFVAPKYENDFMLFLEKNALSKHTKAIGTMIAKDKKSVYML